jgi:hypothetical protein
MTEKQKAFRKSLIKSIHCALQYRVMKENDAWQTTLMAWYGVDSSALLSIDELNNLLAILNGESVKPKQTLRGRPAISTKSGMATASQIKAIESAWINNSREKTSLARVKFMAKVINREVLFLPELTKSEATKALTAMNRMVV